MGKTTVKKEKNIKKNKYDIIKTANTKSVLKISKMRPSTDFYKTLEFITNNLTLHIVKIIFEQLLRCKNRFTNKTITPNEIEPIYDLLTSQFKEQILTRSGLREKIFHREKRANLEDDIIKLKEELKKKQEELRNTKIPKHEKEKENE